MKCIVHVNYKWGGEPWQKKSFIHDTLNTLFGHHSNLITIYIDLSIYFIAYWFLVLLCYTFHTLPNPPLPIMYLYWKDFLEVLTATYLMFYYLNSYPLKLMTFFMLFFLSKMLTIESCYCCRKLLFNFVNGIGYYFLTWSSFYSALLFPLDFTGWFDDFKLFYRSQIFLLLFLDVLSRSRLVWPLLSLYYLSVYPISLYSTEEMLEFFFEAWAVLGFWKRRLYELFIS